MNGAVAKKLGVYDDPAWAGRTIGVPFRRRGFDYSGWHCWGMIYRQFLDVHGIKLPLYGPISAANVEAAAETIERDKALPPWQHVASLRDGETSHALATRVRRSLLAREFDVVIMLNGDATARSHVGLMIGPRRLIHCEAGCDTVKVDLIDVTIAWRVLGFYRHEALA